MAELFKTETEQKCIKLKGLTPITTIKLDSVKYNRPAPPAPTGEKARKKLRKQEFGIIGHLPENREIVQVKYDTRTGIAIMYDDAHYYVAMGLYDAGVTTIMQEHPLGLENGLLPQKCEIGRVNEGNIASSLLGQTLMDQFGEEMDKYDALLKQIEEEKARKEEEERRKAEEEEKMRERQLILEELSKSEEDDEVAEFVERRAIDPMEHLNYIRGEKEFVDMSYPVIGRDTYQTSQVYFTMSHVIRIFELMQKFNAITYRYSRAYYEELMSRAKAYNTAHTMSDFVGDNDQQIGILVLPPSDENDYPCTLFYDIYKTGTITGGYFCLIKANRLKYLYHFKQDEKKFVQDGDYMLSEIYYKDPTSDKRKKDVRKMFMRIVISHLAMEEDAENIISRYSGGDLDKQEEDINTNEIHTEGLVVERNQEWYTTLYVQNEIPVQGYISHRWFNNPNGEGKVLKEVSVRAHSRHGYTRTAKVLNDE